MNANYGFITYGLDRKPGGIGRYSLELLAALRAGGVWPTVLNAGRATEPDAVSLPGAGLLPGLLSIGQVAIAREARRRRLDLVHDPTGTAPLMLTNARRVVTIHDVIPYIYPKTSSRLDRLIYRLWLPLAVRHLDAVITDSECSRRDILTHLPVHPDKVTVVPIAASPRYRPLDRTQTAPVLARLGLTVPYILYVGSVEPRKNVSRLLEAFARLRADAPGYRLVIVGAGRWKTTPIFKTVARLGLEPYVSFTGYVAEEDLPALYAGAALFVFPSLYEGFGLPVLEAMACGTPVVTSNVSSLPEVAGDAALPVNPFDVETIADAMRRVLADPALAAHLRERGLARARQFSWERTARETLAVYERVLATAPYRKVDGYAR